MMRQITICNQFQVLRSTDPDNPDSEDDDDSALPRRVVLNVDSSDATDGSNAGDDSSFLEVVAEVPETVEQWPIAEDISYHTLDEYVSLVHEMEEGFLSPCSDKLCAKLSAKLPCIVSMFAKH